MISSSSSDEAPPAAAPSDSSSDDEAAPAAAPSDSDSDDGLLNMVVGGARRRPQAPPSPPESDDEAIPETQPSSMSQGPPSPPAAEEGGNWVKSVRKTAAVSQRLSAAIPASDNLSESDNDFMIAPPRPIAQDFEEEWQRARTQWREDVVWVKTKKKLKVGRKRPVHWRPAVVVHETNVAKLLREDVHPVGANDLVLAFPLRPIEADPPTDSPVYRRMTNMSDREKAREKKRRQEEGMARKAQAKRWLWIKVPKRKTDTRPMLPLNKELDPAMGKEQQEEVYGKSRQKEDAAMEATYVKTCLEYMPRAEHRKTTQYLTFMRQHAFHLPPAPAQPTETERDSSDDDVVEVEDEAEEAEAEEEEDRHSGSGLDTSAPRRSRVNPKGASLERDEVIQYFCQGRARSRESLREARILAVEGSKEIPLYLDNGERLLRRHPVSKKVGQRWTKEQPIERFSLTTTSKTTMDRLRAEGGLLADNVRDLQRSVSDLVEANPEYAGMVANLGPGAKGKKKTTNKRGSAAATASSDEFEEPPLPRSTKKKKTKAQPSTGSKASKKRGRAERSEAEGEGVEDSVPRTPPRKPKVASSEILESPTQLRAVADSEAARAAAMGSSGPPRARSRDGPMTGGFSFTMAPSAGSAAAAVRPGRRSSARRKL